MSYTHLLLILINVGVIVPKEIKPAKFPHRPKHDPNATCRYHAGYVWNSTKACHVFKNKVQELIDQKFLGFTPVTAEAPIENEPEYKGFSLHVEIPPPTVQSTA